ncbi:MAG: HPP family protein [Rhodocyclaceae bacterium]|jgi:CBS domain-containing membrane protein|nr:HPP family protein [Rhodocyclaceae bacterium]
MRYYFKRMGSKTPCPPRKPWTKIAWSGLGAFVGIYLVAVMSTLVSQDITDHLFLIGSFGASAVLLYGAPQAEFSQPRNLVGGHVLSALIGITLCKLFPEPVALISALAVALSLVAMHATRTIHPPGGATALIAVSGSSNSHMLGYSFVLSPVALGALVMLLVALLINNLSGNPKRHYPMYWF